MDENRIQRIQNSLKKMSDEEKGIQPIVNTCLEGISTASSKIDHGEVCNCGYVSDESMGLCSRKYSSMF